MTIVRDLDGEGHAILTVKTDHGEFVLDNLTDEIRPWDATGYRFVKRQAQNDPERLARPRRRQGPLGFGRFAGERRLSADPVLRSALANVQGGTRGRASAESVCQMKRVMDVLWPVVGLGAVAFSAWLLFRELKGLSLADVEAGLLAISLAHWVLAVAATALAYFALAWYDQIALLHLGRRLSWRFVGLVSFTTYAIAHNIGATMLSGALVRYRAYSTKGLTAAEVGVLVAFCSFTFTLGNLLLGGLVLLIDPDLLRRYVDLPHWGGRAVGGAAA